MQAVEVGKDRATVKGSKASKHHSKVGSEGTKKHVKEGGKKHLLTQKSHKAASHSQEGPQPSITSILSEHEEFTQKMFDQLLTRPSYQNKGTLAALLHSDIERVMAQLQKEFPEVIKISSIGKSYQGRPITLMEVDARDFLVKQRMAELSKQKP